MITNPDEEELEHWSSPDGCHPSCPACEAEYDAEGFQPLTRSEVIKELEKVIAQLRKMPNELSKKTTWNHYHHVTNLMTIEIMVESRKP
jgi:hypothetical protein